MRHLTLPQPNFQQNATTSPTLKESLLNAGPFHKGKLPILSSVFIINWRACHRALTSEVLKITFYMQIKQTVICALSLQRAWDNRSKEDWIASLKRGLVVLLNWSTQSNLKVQFSRSLVGSTWSPTDLKSVFSVIRNKVRDVMRYWGKSQEERGRARSTLQQQFPVKSNRT